MTKRGEANELVDKIILIFQNDLYNRRQQSSWENGFIERKRF